MNLTKTEKKLAANLVKQGCKEITDRISRFELLGADLDLAQIHDILMKTIMRLQEFYSPGDDVEDDNGGGKTAKISGGPKRPSPAEAKSPVPLEAN